MTTLKSLMMWSVRCLWAELGRSVPVPMNCRMNRRLTDRSRQREALHLFPLELLVVTGHGTTECT
jgi:hypothetical protein